MVRDLIFLFEIGFLKREKLAKHARISGLSILMLFDFFRLALPNCKTKLISIKGGH